MKKGDILNNIKVEKLVFGGKGFAHHTDGRVIFIIGGVVPESIVNLRILKSKKDFIEAQVLETVKKSPLEIAHPNNPYGINGGCKRVNIDYNEQLNIKCKQVKEAFFHIEKNLGKKLVFSPIVPSPLIDGYRNKVEFSFGKYISEKEQIQEHFNLGFHKQGQFSKIEDINGFILIKEEVNKIFREIKSFTKNSGLPVYDQKTHQGFYRHLVIRNSHFTDEIMIILSYNPKYFNSESNKFIEIKNFFSKLSKKYPNIKSIYLSSNDSLADISIGELELIYGNPYIVEEILGLKFNISPKSFFQTNSYGAEKLYSVVRDLLKNDENLKGKKGIILDLYAGTGTIGMILSSQAKEVFSVESVKQASQDGEENAKQNNIKNMHFINAKVEDFLKNLEMGVKDGKNPLPKPLYERKKEQNINNVFYKGKIESPITLVIDPPRAGMHPSALPNILKFNAQAIIYVSCNPATLARDIEFILKNSNYSIKNIIPVDMFPHTHHIETVVKLEIN